MTTYVRYTGDTPKLVMLFANGPVEITTAITSCFGACRVDCNLPFGKPLPKNHPKRRRA